MKKCELCKKAARIYCEPDLANLCWDCDYRVHTANFLVANHVRTLLCHVCQCPTPWTGSGPKLGRTITVCRACANRKNSEEDDKESNDHVCNDHNRKDDSENQVVPLFVPQSVKQTAS